MSLNATQLAFASSKAAYPAFVGGFGSGKTAAAIARAMALKAHFRDCDIAYYLPSFPLVEDIALRRFPELCERKGWAYKTRGGTSPHIEFPSAGRVLFRSMSTPASIVGYEVAHSICDELDTMPMELARQAWNKIIARNRQKCAWPNTVAVATTPEGFRFVHERWVKKPAPGYVLFKARTEDNAENLPDGYIDNLRASYPPNLLEAYLNGEFVSLTSGVVYPEFNRQLNGCDTVMAGAEPIMVGMDFNVMEMSAVVTVVRDGAPHAVAELTKVRDTPTMARMLVERYGKTADGARRQIIVYPDASGANTSSKSASESDFTILRQAGLMIRAKASHPAVRDRVNAVNAMILNDKGARRLKVNVNACPSMAEALEQQAYDKNGAPDKTTGHDHLNDALGYRIEMDWPITRPLSSVSSLRI